MVAVKKVTQKEVIEKGNYIETAWLTDKERASADLMTDLVNFYVIKMRYIKRIKREVNYKDGSETYIVTYDNGYRSVYTVVR